MNDALTGQVTKVEMSKPNDEKGDNATKVALILYG
jgi:hypothetical protein